MSNQEEIMKVSIVQLINLWDEVLSNDYMLHVKYTHYQEDADDKLLIDHYLFGAVDWNSYDSTKWNEQNTFHIGAKLDEIEKLLNSKPFFAPKNKSSSGFEKIVSISPCFQTISFMPFIFLSKTAI